jgi:hypothetical protein
MKSTLALAGAMMVAGCTSFSPVRSGETIAPAATVAVTFPSERDLEATNDTVMYSLRAVHRIYGRVERSAADTLVVRVLQVESSRRQPSLPRHARLTIVPSDSARITLRRPAYAQTAVLLGGLTLLGALAIGLGTAEMGGATGY